MTGTKTNERPGTRAVVRDVRMSATKARVVLDLIRNLSVDEATDVLVYTERAAAEVVAKALNSAVANAANNDGIDPETLYVAACYADEGRTLYRFRPRARGRATRIRKRTCHITVIVASMPADMLAVEQAKREAIPGSRAARRRGQDAAARAARVAASQQDDDAEEIDEIDDDIVDEAAETDAPDTPEVDDADVEAPEAVDADTDDDTDTDGADDGTTEDDQTDAEHPLSDEAAPAADGAADDGSEEN